MKLGEMLDLIPDNQEFIVEEYANYTDMVYAWFIRSFNKKDREKLNQVINEEVTSIRTSTGRIYEEGERGILTISILYNPNNKEEQ